jgi:hypothetical protein
MAGIMLVKQRVASIEQWNAVFRDPELDAVRRQHGLASPELMSTQPTPARSSSS